MQFKNKKYLFALTLVAQYFVIIMLFMRILDSKYSNSVKLFKLSTVKLKFYNNFLLRRCEALHYNF